MNFAPQDNYHRVQRTLAQSRARRAVEEDVDPPSMFLIAFGILACIVALIAIGWAASVIT